MDTFLKKYDEKYDKWLKEGGIDYSSKVIPVSESLDSKQWVIPTAQAVSILTGAESFALAPCICKTNYKCDKPIDVCFLLNEIGNKASAQGIARKIDLDEAIEVLKIANEKGLVHLILFKPDRELYALCSCCECCCHDLQLLIKHGRRDLIAHSDFVAETETELCSHCGICIDRCVFNARFQDEETVSYDPKSCYGCGLCITSCPEGAISMVSLPSD